MATQNTNIKLKRASFNQARALKELDYPLEYSLIEDAPISWQGNSFFCGTATCALCPYIEEIAKWLEEEKHIYVDIHTCLPQYEYDYQWQSQLINLPHDGIPLGIIRDTLSDGYKTRDEALSCGIDTAIEIIKKRDLTCIKFIKTLYHL